MLLFKNDSKKEKLILHEAQKVYNLFKLLQYIICDIKE